MSERRIIALDFDGVMNRIDEHGFYLGPEIERKLALRVGGLVKALDALVVVSSDWRHWYTLPELQTVLKKYARIEPGRVLGTTGSTGVRGVEIQAWLRTVSQPVRLAVIDDNHEGRFNMDVVRPWFVRTNHLEGISEADVAAATALLTTGPIYAQTGELTNVQLV